MLWTLSVSYIMHYAVGVFFFFFFKHSASCLEKNSKDMTWEVKSLVTFQGIKTILIIQSNNIEIKKNKHN